MNYINLKKISPLFREIHPYRYLLLYRGQLLVFAGYCIVTLETMIAAALGLTKILYINTLCISGSVLFITLLLFAVIHFNKKLLIWQEWLIFFADLLFYLLFFSVWMYQLSDFRILALFSSLIAISIVLSYTNIYQSMMMSILTMLAYFSTSYYAIVHKGQSGSVVEEGFLVLCLAPAYAIIVVTAKSLEKQRRALRSAKKKLESANTDLRKLNSALKREQSLAKVELELAHDIQSSVFPGKPPRTADWDIAFVSKPKFGVSGDFYDFYCTGDHLDGIALFDVAGHGVAPALITILSKPVLYNNFKNSTDDMLGSILDAAHDELAEQLDDVNIYITGILLRMTGNTVEYANAGHPDLLHLESGSGNVKVLTDTERRFKGKPLGIPMNNFRYGSMKFNVAEGDLLLMFSDGIIDCINSSGERFGRERVSAVLAETSGMNSESALEHILSVLNTFTGNEPLCDDLTVIVARKL